MSSNPYDDRYKQPGYYWGTKPSPLCDKLLELIPPEERAGKQVVDLGCGEGRNAVYLAEHGFDKIWAVDSSAVALEKTQKMARERGVKIETSCQNVNMLSLPAPVDVVISTGTVQYVHPHERESLFGRLKTFGFNGGIHAITALVGKPFIPSSPDADPTAVLFKSGELLGYYWDWEIVYCVEEIFDCTSGGVPHRHCANRMIARKPQT